MVWKKGDLGRFNSEDPKLPRFELIGAEAVEGKRLVRLWYGGESETTTVSWARFKKDCTNTWDFQILNPHAIPTWLEVGASFFLYPNGRLVTVARVSTDFKAKDSPRKLKRPPVKRTLDVGNQMLTVRQIRHDFASCLMEDGRLVLIQLDHIRRWGYRLQSAWERLMEDDEDELDEDLFEGL